MRTLTNLFVCAQLFCATAATAQVPHVLGIWELDLNASSLPQGFPVASETRSYDLRDDGYLVNLVIRKAPDGHPDFIQVVFKSDDTVFAEWPVVSVKAGEERIAETFSAMAWLNPDLGRERRAS